MGVTFAAIFCFLAMCVSATKQPQQLTKEGYLRLPYVIFPFLMAEQRAVIKSFALAGKPVSEAIQHLRESYGKASLSTPRVYALFKEFKDGRQSCEDQLVAFSSCHQAHSGQDHGGEGHYQG